MNRENKPLFLYTFITVFGGLIVGLHMAAVPFLQEQFMLDDMALGLVVSILTVGCLCGALLGGGFSDRYGRQKVMFSSAIFFIVSSLGCALSVNLVSLLVFRLICGLGIGVISAVYIRDFSCPVEGNTGLLQSTGHCDRNSDCLYCRLYIAGLRAELAPDAGIPVLL